MVSLLPGLTTTKPPQAKGAPDVSDALKRVYGIDLGTTYSAIAYVDEHGKPVIVPNQESERITPSVV
ncbi:MAG TPA: Hsp70 family protein, partial [Isosphaeraceae bacterium]|nr:Hsp70 family protein [Isosphaeraceae bacterium]